MCRLIREFDEKRYALALVNIYLSMDVTYLHA